MGGLSRRGEGGLSFMEGRGPAAHSGHFWLGRGWLESLARHSAFTHAEQELPAGAVLVFSSPIVYRMLRKLAILGHEAAVRPTSSIGTVVREFYRHLPFNYYQSVEVQAARLRSRNQVDNYPPLRSLLGAAGPQPRVLELGCGTGGLSNSICLYYQCDVTGVDFNEVAIERARAVAKRLGIQTRFEVADLFAYRPSEPPHITIALGVLHHTHDCLGGVRRVFDSLTLPGGYALIGLYHAYGRKPFLDRFTTLKAQGLREKELLDEYRLLDTRHDDETHVRSWFRDQVLHPSETQHTLAELLPLLAKSNMSLEATSINEFERITSLSALLEEEKQYLEVAERYLAAGKFFPGYFLVLARKRR